MSQLKQHKSFWIGVKVWPLCWVLRDVFYTNRVYKVTNNDEEVTCKICQRKL